MKKYYRDAKDLLTDMELYEIRGGYGDTGKTDLNPSDCIICATCVGCSSNCTVCVNECTQCSTCTACHSTALDVIPLR